MARSEMHTDILVWRVFCRSHLFFLAVTILALVAQFDYVANLLERVETGKWHLRWSFPFVVVANFLIFLVFACGSYLCREIVREFASRTTESPLRTTILSFEEGDREMYFSRFIESSIKYVILLFIVIGIADFFAALEPIYGADNWTWLGKFSNAMRGAAPDFFYATLLYFLWKILQTVREKGGV